MNGYTYPISPEQLVKNCKESLEYFTSEGFAHCVYSQLDSMSLTQEQEAAILISVVRAVQFWGKEECKHTEVFSDTTGRIVFDGEASDNYETVYRCEKCKKIVKPLPSDYDDVITF